MAENKKKRYKKRKKPYPPLSKLDKAIYSISIIILTVLTYGAVWGIMDIQSTLFFRRNDVLAFASYGSVCNTVPYGIMIVIIFLILLNKIQNKRPIFGNKEINYYDSSRYRFILPIFDKRYTGTTLAKEKVIKFSVKAVIISILFICSSLLSLYSISNRYEFTENEIRKCNTKGETVETISYDSIKEYEVATYYHRTGGINSVGFHYLGFTVTLPDGEVVSPDMNCGLKEIKALYKIDKALDKADKTVKIDAQDYIDSHTLTSAEEKMIREIAAK